MGGGSTRAFNIAKGLILNGCDVVVVSAFPHYPAGDIPAKYRWRPLVFERVDGISVIRTPVPPVASEKLTKRLVLFISFAVTSLFALPFSGRVNVVWAANPNLISFVPARIFSFVKRAPVGLNVDDLWPEDMGLPDTSILYKVIRLVARVVYQKAQVITPISPDYVDTINQSYGDHNKKIHVIGGGVDVSIFKPAEDGLTTMKSINEFVVLYSGSFSTAYDFEQVLLAAREVQAGFESSVRFVIQGKGELANNIKRRIVELELNNIALVEKILSRPDVAKMLQQSSALVLPLKDLGRPYSGISSKIYEYQAVGKPVLCCAQGAPSSHIERTRSGIVVRPGDFKSLAESILYLKRHPEVAGELGKNGRDYVERTSTIERIGRKMKVALEQVLQSN